MKLSQVTADNITEEIIQKMVFQNVENNTDAKGDCILVLGGSCPLIDRVPKAAELYKSGRSGKVIFSGGVYWDTVYGRMTEADSMAKLGQKLGIDEKDIIRDNLATTTEENMICGMLAVSRTLMLKNVKSLLLVTSLYHMKRSKEIADLFLPPYVKTYCCPAFGYITPEDWASDAEKERKTIREVTMYRCLVDDGFINDFEI